MVKGQKKLKLGRKGSHKRALVKNLIRSLFENGYLTTTTIKAKALRQEGLKLLNDLKSANPATLRNAQIVLGNVELLKKASEYVANNDAKIKLLKIGFRDGDMAQTSRVTLVGFNTKKEAIVVDKKDEKKKERVEKTTNKVRTNVAKVAKNQTSVVKTERARTRSGL